MNLLKSIHYIKYVVVPCTHIILCCSLYFLFYKNGFIHDFPNKDNLVNWDAVHLASIKNTGYEYYSNIGGNLAFFPGFPFLWKLTGLSSELISIFNLLVFMIAFCTLAYKFKLTYSEQFFFISIPSFIFFTIPYSESLFFCCSTLIILGYHSGNKTLTITGLFLASLIRSVGIFFIPAIIVCEFFSLNIWSWSRTKTLFYIILSPCLAIFIASSLQAFQTGKWFYFIGIQRFWGRHWILPGFPLTTNSPERILWIDGITFIIGMGAILFCFLKAYAVLVKRRQKDDIFLTKNSAIIFSAVFIAITTFLDTFFTYNLRGAGNIWSLNRHVLCTPFAIVFIVWFIKDLPPTVYAKVTITLLILFGIYLTGVYKYWSMMLLYLFFFTALLSIKFYPKLNFIVGLNYVMNVLLQLYFFENYISGKWVA